jgi:hypothetical protein
MDYVVALPSYMRPDVLKTKTMAVLERHNIDRSRIHIFVSDEAQANIYRAALPGYKIIAGGRGLCFIRNFITDYFAEGTPILFMDDDLSQIYELDGKSLKPLVDLHALILSAFTTCVDNHRNLWGIYPVYNAFWMKPGISTDVKFCIGHMYGVLNKQTRKITLDYKEDYERTLLYCAADGGVVRYNNIVAKTKMGAKGGLDTAVKDRLENNRTNSATLLARYPAYVRLNTRRDGEILVKNPKKN